MTFLTLSITTAALASIIGFYLYCVRRVKTVTKAEVRQAMTAINNASDNYSKGYISTLRFVEIVSAHHDVIRAGDILGYVDIVDARSAK